MNKKRQASDPGFSAYGCLFIYFNYTQGNKRHAEWPLTAMSNISFCQIWLFSLTAVTWCLYARLRVRHYEKGGGELSEWPPQEGSIKVKKRAKARDGWTRRREKSGRGETGAPLPGPRHLGWQSPSWLQTAFVKEGKRGSLLHLGMGQ